MNQDNGGVIGKINTPTTLVASGVWSIQDQFEAQSSSTWPLAFPQTTFTNACRFDSASTDRLTRTITGTNTTKFTASMWVKFADDGPNILYASESNSSDYIFIQHNSSGNLNVQMQGTQNRRITNRIFRDSSAWYNFVIVFDSTQATADDRIKVYVNGQQETSFSTNTTNMSQNSNLSPLDDTISFGVGNYPAESQYMNGCIAEFIAVYGQALTPSSFGATNPVTNIWEPIAYTGTYGTNGFKLNFSDSSNLGDDTSGNGNDFTVTNLTSVDQSTDTPSNNFATLNPLEAEANSPTFSDGNLTQTTPNSGGTSGRSTIEVPHTGVWYWEVKIVSTTGTISDNIRLGISTGSSASEGQNLRYMSNGQYVNPSGVSSYGASYAAGDIISVKVDADNNQVTFYKNGASQGAISYTMVAGETYKAFVGEYGSIGSVYSMNFGSAPFSISSGNSDPNGHGNFEYSTDNGYALNTKNLSEFG